MTRDEISRLKTDMYKIVSADCVEEIDPVFTGIILASQSNDEYWLRSKIIRNVNRYLDKLLSEVKE